MAEQGPCGIINLNKPSGPSSHDMVSRVRRSLGTRRAGHAGTLDPMAQGVLVVAVGAATRLLRFISGTQKEYRAGLLLGRTTDSQDTSGVVTSERSAEAVNEGALRQVLAEFLGPILQLPPMVSALKHEGKRLYELARKGITVEREPRPVQIFELQLTSFQSGKEARAELLVRCSSGTYVRTLCADIGERLGSGGCMESLTRTAVGPYRLESAIAVEDLPENPAAVLPPGVAVEHLPGATLDAGQITSIRFGRTIELTSLSAPEVEEDTVRLESASGELIGIAEATRCGDAAWILKPVIVMPFG